MKDITDKADLLCRIYARALHACPEEIIALAIAEERLRCVKVARKMSQAMSEIAMKHPEDSAARDRCQARALSMFRVSEALKNE